MILGMSNKLRAYLKNILDELKNKLENIVYSLYINRKHIETTNIDIKKIDNDLGYMSLDILEQTDYSVLAEYKYLLICIGTTYKMFIV